MQANRGVSPLPLLLTEDVLSHFLMRLSLLAKVLNTCGGFVVIKPELGSVLANDAIKTTVYLG